MEKYFLRQSKEPSKASALPAGRKSIPMNSGMSYQGRNSPFQACARSARIQYSVSNMKTYRVKSESEPGKSYIVVDFENGKYTCVVDTGKPFIPNEEVILCPSIRFKGGECKHILKVKKYLEAKRGK